MATPVSQLQSMQRPLVGGLQIRNNRFIGDVQNSQQAGTGTLGCIARLNRDPSVTVLLGASHVMYHLNAVDGDRLGQHTYQKLACCECYCIGYLEGKVFAPTADAAIAILKDNVAASNEISGLGTINGTNVVAANDAVFKVGCTTSLTSGFVSTFNQPQIEVDGHTFNNHHIIRPTNPDLPFSQKGDSGAVVVNNNNEVIGLLIGDNTPRPFNPSDPKPQGGFVSYVTPIEVIETALDISIITGVFTVSTGQPSAPSSTPSATARRALTSDPLLLLDEQFEQTPGGRQIRKFFRENQEELAYLVNNRRPVTLVWQRKQGPAFLAALLRQAKEPDYQIPTEIEGVSRQNFLMSMATALEDHGSPSLQQAIKQHGLALISAAARSSEIEGILRGMETNLRAGDL